MERINFSSFQYFTLLKRRVVTALELPAGLKPALAIKGLPVIPTESPDRYKRKKGR